MAILTLSVTAEEVIPRNRLRKSIVFQNENASNNIFLKFDVDIGTDVSSTDHDHRLGPNDKFALNSLTDGKKQIEGRTIAVAASGTPMLSFFETEDIIR